LRKLHRGLSGALACAVAMAWKAKPKGDRAAIIELEARCAGLGAGRKSPSVFRVPAMYKGGWAGPVERPRSRSVEPAGMWRSRTGSRAGMLSPLPDRSNSRTSFQHGNWFASSLTDVESHWDATTCFGVVSFHCQYTGLRMSASPSPCACCCAGQAAQAEQAPTIRNRPERRLAAAIKD
jgi:hypothetical protein